MRPVASLNFFRGAARRPSEEITQALATKPIDFAFTSPTSPRHEKILYAAIRTVLI